MKRSFKSLFESLIQSRGILSRPFVERIQRRRICFFRSRVVERIHQPLDYRSLPH